MTKKISVSFAKTLILFAGVNLATSAYTQDYPVGKTSESNTSIERITPMTTESFEGAGWNAGRTPGDYNPGYDSSLPKSFRFTQFQGPHSFTAEGNITRLGDYSAKLHWKHGDPGRWNGDVNIIDNVDRKAMFHGSNASGNSATVWHGFSVYLPSNDIQLETGEELLIFQLHGAPDSGEPGRNPPLALTIQTDGFHVGYGWDAREFATNTSGQGRDKFLIPVNMADYQDRWVDFVIQVNTNPFEESGFIKIWVNGKQMANRTNIQMGYNDARGLYPSWGWYITGNDAYRNKDAIFYLDEIRTVEAADADYYDVAPGHFSEKGNVVNNCPTPELNPADEVFGYQYAVQAKSELVINEPVDVAYGAGGQFAYLYNQTQNIQCNNSTFGGDPIQGTIKHCYTKKVHDGSKPQGYTFATDERREFKSTGTVNIAYGANGQYKYMYNVYNAASCGATTIDCKNSTFGGDPISGTAKQCFYQEATPNNGPSGYLYATAARTSIQLSSTVDVAYGANNTFIYLQNQSGNFTCNNTTFGSDPVPGVKKHCYIKSNSFKKLD